VKFLTYAAVGGTVTLLNLGVQWLCTSAIGLHYLLSAMISFGVLTPLAFWLQKLVTFRTPRANAPVEWPRYLTTMASSLAANLALMYALVSVAGLHYLAASVVVTLVLLLGNFMVNDRWSFAVRR